MIGVFGVVLMAAGLMAAGYGWRVTLAQSDYYRLKYGSLAHAAPEVKAPLAERAHALYPWNYYLSELLAGDFRGPHGDVERDRRLARMTAAAYWCERGRRQNPYGRELAWMAADIARLQSPEAALAIWESYVEFAFWDAWNLAGLVGLMADAGRMEEAVALVPLLRGRPEYAIASSAIENAWKREQLRR